MSLGYTRLSESGRLCEAEHPQSSWLCSNGFLVDLCGTTANEGTRGSLVRMTVLPQTRGAFSFVPLSEFVGRPSWTKSG